jgi:hypothetical protein
MLGLGAEIEQDKDTATTPLSALSSNSNPEGQIWKAKWQASLVPFQDEFLRFVAVACGSTHSLVCE